MIYVETHIGDAVDRVAKMADESVNCVVTSPPYFGLRNYGHDGQFGLESTPDAYVANLVRLFREIRRVLKPDGVVWLNLGDSYCSTPKGNPGARGNINGGKRDDPQRDSGSAINKAKIPGLKQKDLIGIPWMVAFALRADGWYLRQDIIWSKPNPMPESVRDRCTRSHEYIFMLTKSARYFYDAAAIKEPAIYAGLKGQDASGFKNAADFSGKHASSPDVRNERGNKQRGHSRRHDGFNDRWDKMERTERCSGMRNKRSVWRIAPQAYKGAHFATFPPELIRPCVRAGCPQGGVVLDPFGGSGTTAQVCIEEGRGCVLIELNPGYRDLIWARIDKTLAKMEPKPVKVAKVAPVAVAANDAQMRFEWREAG